MYNDGYYAEALEPWREVLKRDGNYRMAYIGISSALYNEGDYENSMKYAKLAESPRQYNKAFEGYRSEWLNRNFTWVILAAAAVIAMMIVLYVWNKKKKKQAKLKL